MAAHYDADRYEEFLEHSAIAEGDLVLAPVALLPSKWVRERRLGVQTKLIATVMVLRGSGADRTVVASSAFLEQRSARLFLLGVIRRILGLKGVAVRSSFWFLFLLCWLLGASCRQGGVFLPQVGLRRALRVVLGLLAPGGASDTHSNLARRRPAHVHSRIFGRHAGLQIREFG